MVFIQLRFSIAGSPGAGKSSLLKELEKRFREPVNIFALPVNTHIGVVKEPVERFQSSPLDSCNMLENYYQNPKQYAQSFQYYCLLEQATVAKEMITKMKLRTLNMDKLVVIEDRSLECCSSFASFLCHKQQHLSPVELEIFQSMQQHFVKEIWQSAHRIVLYLHTPANLAYSRLLMRQHSEEVKNFNFQDFEKLSNHFFDDIQSEIESGNEDVRIIDGSKTTEECADIAEAIILRYKQT